VASADRTDASQPDYAGLVRVGLVGAGVASLVLTAGFFWRWDWATELWPWPDTRLSFVFLASIVAAIGLPALWIGLSGELRAIEAGALDLAVTYAGMVAYVIALLGDPGQPELGGYVAAFAALGLFSLAAYLWSRRIPRRDPRPMPAPVRISFAVLACALIAFGTALLFGADVFPWQLSDESSVMFGLIYLGAAVYFLHGIARPSWSNAAGQLIGFLAYDLVLIGPFLGHFDDASGGQLTSLWIYTGVVVYTACLAIYYLFLQPETRLFAPRMRVAGAPVEGVE
jgi:hypothetical protein